jgi:integrase
MAKILTQLAVDRLKPPAKGRRIFWDAALPGFGLRLSATGARSWVAMGRVDGRPTLETIGSTAQIPKVDQARERARGAILKMKSGTKPLDERKAERRRREAAAVEAERAAERAIHERFDAVAQRFLEERPFQLRKGWAPKYVSEVRRIFEHDLYPRWRGRSIRDIATEDVKALLKAKAATRERPRKGTKGGAEPQANRILARLRTLFAWALAEKLIDNDPTIGVRPYAQAERERERILRLDEIAWFWRGCEDEGGSFGAIFKLMLLTGQREDEIASMRRIELDLKRRVWTIPTVRTKSDRSHIVHLSELTVEIIEAQPHLGDLVFPTSTGKPIRSFSKAKNRLDAAMTLRLHEATGDPNAVIEPWVLHDLRRTATTLMVERLKVAPVVADKILNHSAVVRGIAKIYNRAEFLDERKAALESWSRFLANLVRPTESNVVDLAAAR